MDNNTSTEEKRAEPASHATVRAEQNTLMAILAYIGPLVIVSFLVAKDDPFVKFHIKQGLILFIGHLILWVLHPFLWMLWSIVSLLNLGLIVFSIIGIVNVVQKHKKPLPLIGHLSKYFRF